jgi:hypothetical protein
LHFIPAPPPVSDAEEPEDDTDELPTTLMPSWILRRQLGVMPREYTDLLVELDAQRYIRVDRIPTKGRPKELVTLLGIDK